ncbi:MAG: hypothetical protein KDJ37_17485 [Hyphomicrobiaceae bacterium]|nr:hypothetical protein [Hyphomicrobiaceae bacterium]
MPDPIEQFGPVVFQLGILASLLFIALVVYGIVVTMGRWWLVIAMAAVLSSVVGYLYFGDVLPPADASAPSWLALDARSFAVVAAGYIVLASAIRLATLRLEWRGWKRRTVSDIHILMFLAPTVGAVLAVAP